MPFAIFMLDKPDSKNLRDLHRAAHYQYLMGFTEKLILSGGLLDAAGDVFKGGLIVLDVETAEEAEKFVRDDPFTLAGLQETTHIARMRVAFSGGKRI